MTFNLEPNNELIHPDIRELKLRPGRGYRFLLIGETVRATDWQRFIHNAEYRGLPELRCGQRVKVGEDCGVIVDHDDYRGVTTMSPYHTLCLEKVADTVCSYYGISKQEFYSNCRENKFVWARCVAISIFCSVTNGFVADREIAPAFNVDRSAITWRRRRARRLTIQHPRLAKEHAALLGDAYTKIMQAEEKERMEA